jgi:hypothetical protein
MAPSKSASRPGSRTDLAGFRERDGSSNHLARGDFANLSSKNDRGTKPGGSGPVTPRIMKTHFPVLLAAAAALLLAGCSTFESRSKEKAAVFNSLDTSTQERLKKGEIALGDTAEMVYLALGNPDERISKTTADGETMDWVYNVYWQEYAGSVTTGYRRFVVYDRGSKRYVVYYQPVRSDLYQQRVDERVRVEMKNGRVSSVEETKT